MTEETQTNTSHVDIEALLAESDARVLHTEALLRESTTLSDEARARNEAMQKQFDAEIEAEVAALEQAGIDLLAELDSVDASGEIQ